MDGMPMALLERLYFTAVTCLREINDKLEGYEGCVNALLDPSLLERRDKLHAHIDMLSNAMSAPRDRLQRASLDDTTDGSPTGVIRLRLV